MRSFPQPRKAQSADSAGFESFPLLHNDSRLEKSEGALTLRKEDFPGEKRGDRKSR